MGLPLDPLPLEYDEDRNTVPTEGGQRPGTLRLIAFVAIVTVTPVAIAQSPEFAFVISVMDARGRPVTDLNRTDIRMSENGVVAEVLKVQPYSVPVQLTLAVDNGPLSADALSHYRSGLAGLIRALPSDVEVTLITTSPQPRAVVRPTTDRQRLLRGVNEFAPEAEAPHFTDAIVEFSNRYRTDLEITRRLRSLPVLVMVTTTAPEAVSYEVPAISRAFAFLKQRKAKVYVVSLSGLHRSQGLAPINDNRQAIIGIPLVELTGGRYEALAISNRLATLLPEIGREVAVLHVRHANQLLVSVERAANAAGPLQNLRVEVTRADLTGIVSLDGLP
jgi:hypothetical protein